MIIYEEDIFSDSKRKCPECQVSLIRDYDDLYCNYKIDGRCHFLIKNNAGITSLVRNSSFDNKNFSFLVTFYKNNNLYLFKDRNTYNCSLSNLPDNLILKLINKIMTFSSANLFEEYSRLVILS